MAELVKFQGPVRKRQRFEVGRLATGLEAATIFLIGPVVVDPPLQLLRAVQPLRLDQVAELVLPGSVGQDILPVLDRAAESNVQVGNIRQLARFALAVLHGELLLAQLQACEIRISKHLRTVQLALRAVAVRL